MNKWEAYSILGIKPVDDIRTVKKAYVILSRQFHPEEHPEKWKRIREAYETILALKKEEKAYERHGDFFQTEALENDGNNTLGYFETQGQKKNQGQNQEEDEMGQMFDRLDELVSNERKQNREYHKECVTRAICQMDELRKKKVMDTQVWNDFFSQQEQNILKDNEFCNQWGRILGELEMTEQLHRLMEVWIQCIEQINHTQLWYVRAKLKEKEEQKKAAKNRNNLLLLWAVIAGIFVLLYINEQAKKDDEKKQVTSSVEFEQNMEEWEEIKRHMPMAFEDKIPIVQPDQPSPEEVLDTIVEEDWKEYSEEDTAVLESGQWSHDRIRFEATFLEMNLYNNYIRQDFMEDFQADLNQQLSSGVFLQEGLYLTDGYDEIMDKELFSRPRELTKEELTELTTQGTAYYAFDFWAVNDSQIYLLYLDPTQLGMSENCKIGCFYRSVFRTVEMGNDEMTEQIADYYYPILNYRAFIVHIPTQTEAIPFTVVLYE